MKLLIALLCTVFSALCWSAGDQNGAPTAEPVLCPRATELLAQHLYGRWHAEFSEAGQSQVTTTATLLFEPNPDFAQSVSGSVVRGEAKALLSGDADEGEFALDESVDGVNISATWTGRVVPDTCGREIRGQWSDVAQKAALDFVLRKLPENRP
jgi:hypothetical protein